MDQNSLNKPDSTSNYSTEVWQTLRAHILRLWVGDYSGMGDLVAGIKRWVRVGTTDVKLVERDAQGAEVTLFDSSSKVNKTDVENLLNAKLNRAQRVNWANKDVSLAVAGMIPWRNYGNGHVIFDASKGLSPEDTAIDNTNPVNAWVETCPTLMGWNGVQTYGVRVDSAKKADNADGTLGGSQIWMDVKAFRVLGVTYTNTTSRPILIAADIFQANSDVAVYVENKLIMFFPQASFSAAHPFFIVGVNQSYSITYLTSSVSVIAKWHEFREY